MKKEYQLKQNAFRPGEGFISRYQELIRTVAIPYQYSVLCDKVSGVEKSHVVQNFINAGKALRGEDVGDGFYGMVFQDSDAAKWLEAVAYSLTLCPDAKLEQTADELIEYIAAAQDTDGYLNTYFTIKDKDKRMTNLAEGHELYCAGHMMEAACAYYEATGKDRLLKVMQKNMEYFYRYFITEKKSGCPGHPEVELALMKMYHLTGDEHCLELAKYFIDVRGVDASFFEKEAAARDWTVWGLDTTDHEYMQSGKPVREQVDAVGHAVRAVYLYTGMADLSSTMDDKELYQACRTLWESITQRRMYLTGGIGSTGIGEAFSVDYDLPGDTAYAETCASIGLMFFASRMLENEVDSEYADVMEKAFYNTVLAGMQLDGTRFFYVNPLEIIPGISGVAPTHKHDLPQRPGWYTCACCPPNAARLISSIGQYAYGENENTAFCHMYADGEVSFENGLKISCNTKYPYEFDVNYEVLSGSGMLAIRIPSWSKTCMLTRNGEQITEAPVKGYIYVSVSEGDKLMLSLDQTPYVVYASAKVPRLSGQVAVCRGPLVYCFEGVDNDDDVLSLSLVDGGSIEVMEFDEALLRGTTRLRVEAVRFKTSDSLYTTEKPEVIKCQAIAVPYYTWGNRGENQMRVWMQRYQ